MAEYFLFRKYPFSLELQAIALCAGRSRQNDWGVLRLVRDDGKRATVKWKGSSLESEMEFDTELYKLLHRWRLIYLALLFDFPCHKVREVNLPTPNSKCWIVTIHLPFFFSCHVSHSYGVVHFQVAFQLVSRVRISPAQSSKPSDLTEVLGSFPRKKIWWD